MNKIDEYENNIFDLKNTIKSQDILIKNFEKDCETHTKEKNLRKKLESQKKE